MVPDSDQHTNMRLNRPSQRHATNSHPVGLDHDNSHPVGLDHDNSHPVGLDSVDLDPALAGRAPWILVALLGAIIAAVALAGVSLTVGILGMIIEACFVAYFVRHLAFTTSALHYARRDIDTFSLDPGWRPSVSVLVACHNEEAVVTSLVDHLLVLDYPADRLELMVVDDGSTDKTGSMLDELAAAHPQLKCLHRPAGAGGGKSGALNAGLEHVTGDIIVVFDADHWPRPDVIWRLARHFADPAVGAVQGRCVIRNGAESQLAHLVGIDYLAGYLVNEYGRQAIFTLPAYGGANCAVRASSLRAIGGWNVRSVTDDTDLTLRLLLRGERVRYDVTAIDEEEGAVALGQYWRQRYRWARGHQQVWRDYRRAVWQTPYLTVPEKIETTMFLLAFHLPVLSTAGLVVSAFWLAGVAPPVDSANLFVLWLLLFIGPLLEFGAGLLIAARDRREITAVAYFLPLFFLSMAICTKAWLDGILGRRYAWVKTARSAEVTRSLRSSQLAS